MNLRRAFILNPTDLRIVERQDEASEGDFGNASDRRSSAILESSVWEGPCRCNPFSGVSPVSRLHGRIQDRDREDAVLP